MTKDDLVAPSDLQATTSHSDSPPIERALRVLVYCVACLGAIIAVWALIQGGDREAWTRAAALAPALFAGT